MHLSQWSLLDQFDRNFHFRVFMFCEHDRPEAAFSKLAKLDILIEELSKTLLLADLRFASLEILVRFEKNVASTFTRECKLQVIRRILLQNIARQRI